MAVQKAGVAALGAWPISAPKTVATFKERRDAAVNRVPRRRFRVESPRARCTSGSRCRRCAVDAVHERLIEQEGVIVLPRRGLGEGGEGYFRVSFITSR